MTPIEYLTAEFRRYYPNATDVHVYFGTDETITVNVHIPWEPLGNSPPIEPLCLTYFMEIGSDDDYFRFVRLEDDAPLDSVPEDHSLTIPFMPESE